MRRSGGRERTTNAQETERRSPRRASPAPAGGRGRESERGTARKQKGGRCRTPARAHPTWKVQAAPGRPGKIFAHHRRASTATRPRANVHATTKEKIGYVAHLRRRGQGPREERNELPLRPIGSGTHDGRVGAGGFAHNSKAIMRRTDGRPAGRARVQVIDLDLKLWAAGLKWILTVTGLGVWEQLGQDCWA